MEMNDRLQIFIQHLGLSERKFALSVSMTPQNLNNIRSGLNKISYKNLTNIISKYTDLNIRWLILGDGDMIIDNENKIDYTVLKECQEKYNTRENIINDTKHENELLKQKVKYLEELLVKERETIDILKKLVDK